MWQVEQLRITLFPLAGLDVSAAQGWWHQATGREPDSSSFDRRVGLVIEEGQVGGEAGTAGTLSLQAQTFRVDWRWTNPDLPDEVTWNIVGTWADSRQFFLELMRPWIGVLPFSLQRFALGAVLLAPVDGVEAGYAALGPFVPFTLDPSARDFTYQINRRRMSTVVEGLMVNRLAKWSVARRESLEFSVSASGPGPSVASRQAIFAARAELDINSSPEWQGELPAEHLTNLIAEFSALADELAERGDVP